MEHETQQQWRAYQKQLHDGDFERIMCTFMARDYWIKLDHFYHNRYAEAVPDVTSAKECAEWCERIWLARSYLRNGNDKETYRKRLGSPTNINETRKLPRTTEESYSGPRHDKARIQRRELREPPPRDPPSTDRPPPTTGSNNQALPRAREPVTCYNCGPDARIQTVGIEDGGNPGDPYLGPSDSEDDSENEER
ncbi:hypothetical protein B0T26DRAFT_804615 [Lasiosphaeria miniovina]|uniref:Uncharacterized protein n=1 Tax=Lasiosphaeria miniovina TaxID=1954250 RepID=A0AA40ADS4_9PEZI|nr:uncharacterized protein B0T26DRAFT_804615 [Lasiosphaeria miniovina]KAK0713981.1 hypothetical protein B0T26DRAFT_804615 [Lasiosphaeria miniovina]